MLDKLDSHFCYVHVHGAYDLCQYRDVWVKVTAWMVYLQKAKTSRVRADYSVFAQQYSAAAAAVAFGGVHMTSSSSVIECEALRRYLREGLPMYSNLLRSVSISDDVAGVCSADTNCDDTTIKVGDNEAAASRQENSTSCHTRL